MKRKITCMTTYEHLAFPYRKQHRWLVAIYEMRREQQNLSPLQEENLPLWYEEKMNQLKEEMLKEAMMYKDSLHQHVRVETPTTIDYSYRRADVLQKKYARKMLELNYRLVKEGYLPPNTQYPENWFLETLVWQQSKKTSDSKKGSRPLLMRLQQFLRNIIKTRK